MPSGQMPRELLIGAVSLPVESLENAITESVAVMRGWGEGTDGLK